MHAYQQGWVSGFPLSQRNDTVEGRIIMRRQTNELGSDSLCEVVMEYREKTAILYRSMVFRGCIPATVVASVAVTIVEVYGTNGTVGRISCNSR